MRLQSGKETISIYRKSDIRFNATQNCKTNEYLDAHVTDTIWAIIWRPGYPLPLIFSQGMQT